MKNKILIFILLILCILIVIGYKYLNAPEGLKGASYSITLSEELITKQNNKEELYKDYLLSEEYTFEFPKIVESPYELINNSYLIIFKTSEKVAIDLYINDELVSSYEPSYEHVLPVMNLNEGINKVKYVTEHLTANEIELSGKKDDLSSKTIKFLENGYILFTSNNNYYYLTDYSGRIYECGLNYTYKNYTEENLSYKAEFNFNEPIIKLDNIDLSNKIDYDSISNKLNNATKFIDYKISNYNLVINNSSSNIKVYLIHEKEIYEVEYNKKFSLYGLTTDYNLYISIDDSFYNLDINVR